MDTTDLTATTGCTYRQLDHWVNQGWLHAVPRRPGTGINRHWPEHEINVAVIMGQLVKAGIRPPKAAAAARRLADAPDQPAPLNDRITLRLTG